MLEKITKHLFHQRPRERRKGDKGNNNRIFYGDSVGFMEFPDQGGIRDRDTFVYGIAGNTPGNSRTIKRDVSDILVSMGGAMVDGEEKETKAGIRQVLHQLKIDMVKCVDLHSCPFGKALLACGLAKEDPKGRVVCDLWEERKVFK